jgi:RNA polymerase sigma-70 factor (ECF subfamily)
MDPESERELVTRLRAGDAAAFDEVFDRFNIRLFSFLARLSKRRCVAEDLVEETWLRFVSRAAQLAPDTRLQPWLFTVAHNLYVSYRRSRAVEDSHGSGLIGLWPYGSPGPSPFESAAATETGQRLEEALAALPVDAREVLLLVAVEGLTPSEAAQVCGVSAVAMRKRLSRARALLARRLAEGVERRLLALNEVRT